MKVPVPSKSNKQKKFRKKIFFVDVLKVKDEKSTIRNPDPLFIGMNPRIRIRTKISWIRNIASGWSIAGTQEATLKCVSEPLGTLCM